MTSGNRIENNTIYNQISNPATTEYGVYAQRSGASIRNNIIALVSPTTSPLAMYVNVPNYKQTIQSDYNLFWVPGGSIGFARQAADLDYGLIVLADACLDADPEAADLWRWHAAEEIEHKGVAYDTWAHATRHWPRAKRWKVKAKVMLFVTRNFIVDRTAGALELMRQDGVTGAIVGAAFGIQHPDVGPLRWDEFKDRVGQTVYLSATPGRYEMGIADGVDEVHIDKDVVMGTKEPVRVYAKKDKASSSGDAA